MAGRNKRTRWFVNGKGITGESVKVGMIKKKKCSRGAESERGWRYRVWRERERQVYISFFQKIVPPTC